MVGLAINLELGYLNSTAMLIQWDPADGSWDSYTLTVSAYDNNTVVCYNETDLDPLEVFCDGLIPGTSYNIDVTTNLEKRPSNTIGIIDHTRE